MSPKPIIENTLFYGDNLPNLREYIPDRSVDFIILDPPFISKRTYKVVFRDESGKEAETQMAAFPTTPVLPSTVTVEQINEELFGSPK